MADAVAFINIVANIAIGIVGFRSQWQLARELKSQWRWIKQGLAITCLLWSILYFFVLLDILHIGQPINSEFTRVWFVRPLITITITLIAVSGIARRKTG